MNDLDTGESLRNLKQIREMAEQRGLDKPPGLDQMIWMGEMHALDIWSKADYQAKRDSIPEALRDPPAGCEALVS